MVRPVLHLALKSMEDSSSFWHRLLVSPANFRGAMLPFMPGDEAAAVLATVGATQQEGVYACSCGYVYTIGNCRRPWIQAKCPECHSQIGGVRHELQQGNHRLEDTNDVRWRRRAGQPGFSNVRGEASRQTWRQLTVNELRSGRFFMHGLLSLGQALWPRNRRELTELSAKELMGNMAKDWQILKELRNCSAEALSEQLHAVVVQSWNLPSPGGRGETERIQLEHRWSQHLRHAPSGG